MKNLSGCCLIILLMIFAAISIHAQFEDEGKLNVWTTGKVQRNPETDDASYSVCRVRAARQKGYDRLVFEFDGGEPQYVIQYLPSDIYSTDGGDRKINIAGNVFMMVNLYGMGVDEKPCKVESYPKKKLNFPTLMQIQRAAWFEGIQDFLIGVKSEKPFRVQTLSNPSRLIIDFKH